MIINSFSYSDVDHFWLNESRRWGEFKISRSRDRKFRSSSWLKLSSKNLNQNPIKLVWRNKGSSLVHRSSDIDMIHESWFLFILWSNSAPESFRLSRISFAYISIIVMAPPHISCQTNPYRIDNLLTGRKRDKQSLLADKKKNHVSAKPTDG